MNQAAIRAFREWRSRWPEAKPEDYIFHTEKLAFKGEGPPEKGMMTAYAVNPKQAPCSLEARVEHGQETDWRRVPDSRSAPLHLPR